MRLPLILCATLTVAACVEQSNVTIVSSVTPEQRDACVAAAAGARDVPQALVVVNSAQATQTGPIVNLSIGGEVANCKLDELGRVQDVTFASS